MPTYASHIATDSEHLRSILDSAPYAYVAMDRFGHIVDWNTRATDIFGWSRSEVLEKPLAEILIPERYRKEFTNGLRRFTGIDNARMMIRRLELVATHKFGHELMVELSISCVKQKKELVFAAFLQDISARVQVQKVLAVQLAITQILADVPVIGDVFRLFIKEICRGFGWEIGVLWVPNGKHLVCSEVWHRDIPELGGFCQQLGRTSFAREEGLPGKVWVAGKSIWLEDIADDHVFFRTRALRRVGLRCAAAFPLWFGDELIGVMELFSKTPKAANEHLQQMMNDLGMRIGMLVERKRTEEQVRESEERYRQLVSAVRDYAIYMLDREGKIASWNAGAASITGYRDEEVIGKHVSIFYPDEVRSSDAPDQELNEAKARGRFEGEGWRVCKDGSKFWANVVITSICDDTGHLIGFSEVTRDITDRKRIEEQRQQLHAELERRVDERTQTLKMREVELQRAKDNADAANLAKSAFLANMSHEIRTPLGAVLGFAELLTTLHQDPEDREHCIDAIKRNGRLLSQIINDILDLSKVEAGRLEIERVSVWMHDVIAELSSLLSLQATEKGLKFHVCTEGEIPDSIETDPLRLKQILTNIVGNAIKFTQKGSILITIKQLQTDAGDTKLAFIVKDTGSGVSPEQAERIFSPFSQADASTTRKYGGTGLGLALSKNLAHALGGDLQLTQSEVGKGSTFAITIDPGIASRQVFERIDTPWSQGSMPNSLGAQEICLSGVRVLVVDDAQDNRHLVSTFLTVAGAVVDCADNGLEALKKVRDKDYEVVLMDLQMPVMDGYEAISEMRASGYKKPVLALTASVMKEEKMRCLKVGFEDHLSKPIDRRLLLNKIVEITKPTGFIV